MVASTAESATCIAVDAGVLRAAADLIGDCADLERRAFLRGYADGWRDGLRAGAERGCAA
jgi:hypothetical protein